MLNIIYRPYSGETDGIGIRSEGHRPDWFTKQNTYKSLSNSILANKEHVKTFYVLFDGFEGSFYQYIIEDVQKLKSFGVQVDFQKMVGGGSVYNSLKVATKFGCDLGGDTYFVEDDYFHLPEAIGKIAKALPNLKLLSGYDHLDRYTRTDDIDYPHIIKFDKPSNHHWRTSESTGHSYAIEGSLMEEIKHLLMSHEFTVSDRELWRYLHRQKIHLYTAIPGFVTQVDPYLSPGVDWSYYSKQV